MRSTLRRAMARAYPRNAARVALSAAGLVVSGVWALGCSDDPLGPSGPPQANLAFVMRLTGQASRVLPLELARFSLTRSNGHLALDTTVTIPADADSIVVDLSIPLLLSAPTYPPSERFVFELALTSSAGEPFFAGGPDTVDATGDAITFISSSLRYIGVGYDAESIEITAPPGIDFEDTVQVEATVLDSTSQPISGAPVIWVSLDTTRLIVIDQEAGLVAARSNRGSAELEAQLLTGQKDTVAIAVRPVPTGLTMLAGDGQEGVIGEALPDSLRIQVLASDGFGVPAANVGFAVVAGDGTLSTTNAVTDDDGIAAVAWTIGAQDTQHVEVTIGAVAPVTFTAFALRAATLEMVEGADQVAMAGSEVADSVVVRAVSLSGRGVPSMFVHFDVVAGTGTLSADSVLTDADGHAHIAWALGPERRQRVAVLAGELAPIDVAAYTIDESRESLFATWHQTCALDPSGQLYCWGQGSSAFAMTATPTPIASGFTFTSVDVSHVYACGITPAADAHCVGDGGLALGDGSTMATATPVLVAGGHQFRSITTASGHACGITIADEAFCWGLNGAGQLGTGNNIQSHAPVAVAGGHRFATISAEASHTCALTIDGRAYCWGNGTFGELGNGGLISATSPQAVLGNRRFVSS